MAEEGKSVRELAAERSEPRIASSLEALVVPVADLRPHPENARRGDLDRIADSLVRFGQLRPILVQESTGFIVAGNHVYRAATELLDWGRIAAAVEALDDQTAKAYLLADNRLAELGTYDDLALAAMLRELSEQDALAATGYPEGGDALAALLRRLAPTPGGEFPVAGEEEDDYRCPDCGYTWSGQPRPEVAG